MLQINQYVFLLFFLQNLVSNIMTLNSSDTAAYQPRVTKHVQLPKNTIGYHR